MAYFEPYIDAEGVHCPTYDDVLEYLINQYLAIFGQDTYLGPETPDYQMMSVVAKCIADFSALATQAYYERDPQYASGNSLDIIAQMSGLTRKTPTASTATLTLSGEPGTVIPAGKQAIDASGNLWTTDSQATIPSGGSVEVSATCDTLGAVIAPAGTISSIYTPLPGWTGVTNEEEANVGTDLETDAELRARFMASHAMTNSGIIDAFTTGLLSVAGVRFVDVVENSTDSTDDNGLPPHSICAVVDGGEDEEVAQKILFLKSPGVATYGNTTEDVEDRDGNSYEINFSRPQTTVVPIVITVKNLGGYDASRVDGIIKAAIADDVNSLGIGKSWALTMGYRDIYSQFVSGVPFAVISIESTEADSDGIVECDFDHVLSTDDSHITIVVSE